MPVVCLQSLFILLLSALSMFAAERPNIVFILADDLGYGEVGAFGQQKIRTPNIDRLAKQGMRLTQHYTGAPVCAPARCVLMTGRHLAHAEIRGNRESDREDLGPFPGQWPLTDSAVTIAEVLKREGYRTGAFGKWGLGPADSTGSPLERGFTRFYGYICQRNAHSYYPPYLYDDKGREQINEDPVPGHLRQHEGEVRAESYRAEVYAPDRILEEALAFIDVNKDRPFFLYLPFVEPHVAIQSPQELIDTYPEAWDEGREYRGQNSYLPHPRPRAAYAAMITDLDEHVGSILARLHKHGLAENTLIVFTSDNGPTHGGPDGRFHIGGADISFFNSTGGLRGYKGSCYEGGIRVPTIVRWPGKVKPGTECDMPSYFPDWFPTFAGIIGAKLPENSVLDGQDLREVLESGEKQPRSAPMVWEFSGYGGILAVRDGDWKLLVRAYKTEQGPEAFELYNLAKDPEESQNLAPKLPKIAEKLHQYWLNTRIHEPDFPFGEIDELP